MIPKRGLMVGVGTVIAWLALDTNRVESVHTSTDPERQFAEFAATLSGDCNSHVSGHLGFTGD